MRDEKVEQVVREVLRTMWISLAVVVAIIIGAYLARIGWDLGANGGGWS